MVPEFAAAPFAVLDLLMRDDARRSRSLAYAPFGGNSRLDGERLEQWLRDAVWA